MPQAVEGNADVGATVDVPFDALARGGVVELMAVTVVGRERGV